MTTIAYTNPIIAIEEGLMKGLGIGGVVMGIVGAIGIFLVILGLLGYIIITVADVVEAAREKAVDAAAEGINAAAEGVKEVRERVAEAADRPAHAPRHTRRAVTYDPFTVEK